MDRALSNVLVLRLHTVRSSDASPKMLTPIFEYHDRIFRLDPREYSCHAFPESTSIFQNYAADDLLQQTPSCSRRPYATSDHMQQMTICNRLSYAADVQARYSNQRIISCPAVRRLMKRRLSMESPHQEAYYMYLSV